ncbi:interleukin-1 receptor type 1 isoform X2 [Girardinichthys multiradiatus]|uniref:interleukin-1 receptor type 1 isoform X2 n=1 Tax=Girardinichthys multiradiatus TaxID=208333 RepID=UPI001FADD3E0|nr:interleukin-1 receptor type 1 isoform X2 [Girardinichthys multiradiatus]
MAAGGWVCFLTGLLSLASAVDHNHQGEADTYHVSVGHLFLLKCQPADAHSEIMWSRGDSGNESLPTGVEVRDGLLWFQPVQITHTGSYICEKRNETTSSKRRFRVLVSRKDCPDPNENISVVKRVRDGLRCKQTEIFRLNLTRKIRWMKDCQPVQLDEESIYLNVDGFMRLPAVSERDAGKYTCLIDITVDGQNYTTARSIQLTVTNGAPEVFPELHVISPLNDVVIVQVGKRAELQCLAYTGFSEDTEIFMFWTINGTYASDYTGLKESWTFIHDRGKVYGQSNLSISIVRHEFLNVPINCHISSPVEEKFGKAWLQEADHGVFYMNVAICLSAPITLLLLTAFIFICKVDLILAYRKLTTTFSKQQVADGKLYDAYVSVGQSAMLNLDGVACFALQILPKELEQKHGYYMYIRGRDDCPGEAVHDIITAAVRQCRRLIIILSSHGKTKETVQPWGNQSQLLYEQKVGLHDALMHNDPKVILVEVDQLFASAQQS